MPAPRARSGGGADRGQSLRDLRQRRPRHGRLHRSPSAADHHGPRGGGRHRRGGKRGPGLGAGAAGHLRLHHLLRQLLALPTGGDQPLRQPPCPRGLLRRVPAARGLRRVRGRAGPHPLRPAGCGQLPPGGDGGSPVHRRPRGAQDSAGAERLRPGGRGGEHRPVGGPGSESLRLQPGDRRGYRRGQTRTGPDHSVRMW